MTQQTANQPSFQDPRIVVGLTTCRNPAGLEKGLSYLARQKTRFSYQIIIVDNDEGMAGKDVAQRHAQGSDVPIRYEVEPEQGIPFARNRVASAFLETDADILVMFDDDEYPDEAWLETLVEASLRHSADVVGGPVKAVLASPATAPIEASDYNQLGGKVFPGGALVESTANLLVTRRVFEAIDGEWFRGAFAQTGGSDTDFLRRTAGLGFRHAVAADALVYEDVPESRISPAWWKKRAYRSGGCIVVARQMNDGIVRTLVFETASIAYLLAMGSARFVLSGDGTRKKHKATLMLARGRGKAAAILGRRYNEYSQANYR